MEDFPTAEQTRDSRYIECDRVNYILKRIREQIEQAAKSPYDNESTNISLNSVDDDTGISDQHHYEVLARYLREKGYTVSWNRACLWMEISWHG